MGFTVDLADKWEGYRAAKQALSNTIVLTNVQYWQQKHWSKVAVLTKEILAFLVEVIGSFPSPFLFFCFFSFGEHSFLFVLDCFVFNFGIVILIYSQGVLVEEYILDNIPKLLACLRDANATLRWLLLRIRTKTKNEN